MSVFGDRRPAKSASLLLNVVMTNASAYALKNTVIIHVLTLPSSCSSDWELLVPLGRLSEKLGRPISESLEVFGKASESAGMVVHPIYRLHASRMKTLCRFCECPEVWSALQGLRVSDGELDSEGTEETDGSGAQEGLEVWGVLKEIAKHCFLPATVRRLRGLGFIAEAKGPCEGEESEEDETGQVEGGNADGGNDKASAQGLAENEGATEQVEKESEGTGNRKTGTLEERGLVEESEGEAGQVEKGDEGVENSEARTREEGSLQEIGGPGKEGLVKEKGGQTGKEGLVKEKGGETGKEGLFKEKGGETGRVERENENAEKVKASTWEEEGKGGPERDLEQAQSMEVDEGALNAGVKLSSDGRRASAGEEGIMGGEGTAMGNTNGRPEDEKQPMEGGGDAPNPSVRDVGQLDATVTNDREAIAPLTTKTDKNEDLETISTTTAHVPAPLTDPKTSIKPAYTPISAPLSEVWEVLFRDALAGLRFCISGEMKHFHKARYRVAHAVLVQGGGEGEQKAVEAAKAELAFFFKTGRGAFTMNVWELDAPKKKKW